MQALLLDSSNRNVELDQLKTELAHATMASESKVSYLQRLLEESLHAVASEKIANDLLREEDEKFQSQFSRMEASFSPDRHNLIQLLPRTCHNVTRTLPPDLSQLNPNLHPGSVTT